MASNKRFTFGPIALTNTLTTNILNPPTATGGVNAGSAAMYVILNWLRIVNKTAGAVPVTLYKGATGANAAGTEYLFNGYSVPANSYVDAYPYDRFESTHFLVGGAGANTSLVIMGSGEIGVA